MGPTMKKPPAVTLVRAEAIIKSVPKNAKTNPIKKSLKNIEGDALGVQRASLKHLRQSQDEVSKHISQADDPQPLQT
jgi:hypothetical protein